jgi:hypothetical protein
MSSPTCIDVHIVHGLRDVRQGNGRGVHALYHTFGAEQIDADLMKRLSRTRKNNKRARAFPEQPGEVA